MIQIKQVLDIPDCAWHWHSEPKVGASRDYIRSLEQRSTDMYWLRNGKQDIAIVGFSKTSMIGSQWRLWCLFCDCDLRRNARALRKLLHKYLKMRGHLTVVVDAGYDKGMRFAQFMGFIETSRVGAIDGRDLAFFELDREWLTRLPQQQH